MSPCPVRSRCASFFFFFNDPATTEFSPLPLPAALPILRPAKVKVTPAAPRRPAQVAGAVKATEISRSLRKLADSTHPADVPACHAANGTWSARGVEIGRAHV